MVIVPISVVTPLTFAVTGTALTRHAINALTQVFGERKSKHIPLNITALKRGIKWIEEGESNIDSIWELPKAAQTMR